MDQNINPLDVDLSSIDTKRPLIAGPQNLDFKIEKAELVTGTVNTASKMLSLELSTIAPCQSVSGDSLNAGIRVFHRENYAVTGKLKPDQIAKGIGAIVQKAGIAAPGVRVSNIDTWYKQLEGRVLPKVRVTVEPEQSKNGKTYPPKNAVSFY